jgi:hypothetical protein
MQSSAKTPQETKEEARKSDDKESMSAPSVAEIMPDYINDMGKAYLTKHPKHIINLFNSNQSIADKMVAYRPAGNATTKRSHEIFLTNRYYELPNYHGQLAASIREFFLANFKKQLSQTFLIKNISVQTLQELGNEYLAAHPKSSSWYSFTKHQNQTQASQLRDCDKIIDPRTQHPFPTDTPLGLWQILIYIYACLPSDRGELALKIENIISNVFEIVFDKTEVMGNARARSTLEIASLVEQQVINKVSTVCSNNEMQAMSSHKASLH